jgi:hypothetical protein
MSEVDNRDIRVLANQLSKLAASIRFVYFGLGAGAGALLGAALLADGGDWRFASAAVWGVMGASIGHALGQARAATLRLQALSALRQIESNT